MFTYLSAQTMRNWFLLLTAVILAGCSQAGSVSPLTDTPNPANTLASPVGTLTPTTTSSPSLPGIEWETFTSVNWQIAVDYPPDWSVSEQPDSVSFTSPSGMVIQLTKIETGALSPEEFLGENQLPNTRCSTNENSYEINVHVCFDTISGGYSAEFIHTSSQGMPQLLSIVIMREGDLQVFDRMVGSIRPR